MATKFVDSLAAFSSKSAYCRTPNVFFLSVLFSDVCTTFITVWCLPRMWCVWEEKLGVNATKHEAADACLPTPWLFEPAKRPDHRADYRLDCVGVYGARQILQNYIPVYTLNSL